MASDTVPVPLSLEATTSASTVTADGAVVVVVSSNLLIWLFAIILIALTLCLSCCCCMIVIWQSEAWYREFNDEEWHISGLPSIVAPIRGCNAAGCGCGPSCAAMVSLWLLDQLAVRPALRASLVMMKRAEESRRVDPILCCELARHHMKQRIDQYYRDIRNSPTLSLFSKIMNYSAAAHCLSNHCGILQQGMTWEVAAQKVIEPVFIVSLPRTATTVLHRTMSLDRERWRSFDLCDMICPLPAPIPRDNVKERQDLAERAEKELGAVDSIFPGFRECMETMHGFRCNEAEEDWGWYDTGLGHMYMGVLILMYPQQRAKEGGKSHLESADCAQYRYAWLDLVMRIYQAADRKYDRFHNTTMNYGSIPSSPGQTLVDSLAYSLDQQTEHSVLSSFGEGETPFFRWSSTCSSSIVRGETIENVEKGLVHMDSRPWLMKDPNHAAFLPQLIEQFPDAKLIFTHRAPSDLVASLAKTFVCFACVQHEPGTPGTTAKEWGEEALARTDDFCDGLVAFTRHHAGTPLGLNRGESKQRIDFRFEELVKDMPASIKIIYERFFPDKPPPSSQAMSAFKAYLEENERQKRGNQRQSLEDFHLTTQDVAFPEYTRMFLSK